MDDFYGLTDKQRDMVFQLMEIIGNNNIELAQVVLTMNNWNLEAAIQNFLTDATVNPRLQQQRKSSSEEEEFRWQQPPDLEKKKSDFNQLFPDLKLTEQVSDLLSMRRQSSTTKEDTERIKKYAERLAKDNPKYQKALDNSQKQVESNRKFIGYLQSNFKTGINFAFGDFSSNLMKSYVKKKPLLVYVHHVTDSGPAKQLMGQLLQDPRIAEFLNRNFVIYGMFDNSSDYSLVQPSLPLSLLPGYAVFVYDEKKKSEVCLGAESLLRKDRQGIMNFVTKSLEKAQQQGTAVKKEQPTSWKQTEEEARRAEHNIKDEQQEIYEQLEKEFKMKREQSKLRKVDREKELKRVEQIRKNFEEEPKAGPGVMEIHFRQPVTGKAIRRRFRLNDKIDHLFTFVEGFCSAEFENEFGKFDLVQTYPPLSLLSHTEETVMQVFGESEGESLIIKEL